MGKLKRSNSNKVFAGICGGLGEFFNIDPTIVRVIYAIFFVRYFSFAFLIYIVCSLVIPIDDGVIHPADYNEHNDKIRKNTPLLIGGGLIIWGSILLSRIMFPWFSLRIMHLVRYWPALLIVLGIYVLFNQKN